MTTVPPTTDKTCAPKVWLGCLHCYNSGRLVGQWTDCTDVEGMTLIELHAGSGRSYAACAEVWCFDHEYVPVDGEFGPLEAAEWGRVFEEAGAEHWDAVCAWVRSGSYVAEGRGDLPSVSDFEERYAGRWASFVEYSDRLAEDTGLMKGWPEDAIRYFDWRSSPAEWCSGSFV